MAADFATPIAHQTGSNYSAFNNALVVGRPYQQPLLSAPNPANFSPGLELFMQNTGDIPAIYSWFDGTLHWQAATATAPGDRLILDTPDNGKGSMQGLNIIESYPRKTIYENVAQAEVIAALTTLLTTAYTAAGTTSDARRWHPAMRQKITNGTRNPPRLKEYIDRHAPANTTISQLVTAFVGGSATVMRSLAVRAGDKIGRAAPYLSSDPLPASAPFPLGGAADPTRACRLTFQTLDSCLQHINPLYYLHICMQQMLISTGRVITSLTNIVAGSALAHPLVTLYPALAGAAVPPARERVNGQFKIPLGRLVDFHGHPLAAPVSAHEWHYTDQSIFEWRRRGSGGTPTVMQPSATQTNRVRNLWTAHGASIAAISEALQIPAEVIIGLIGAEAAGDPNNINLFSPRSVRLEPLTRENRKELRAGGVSAARVLEYDKTNGLGATFTRVAQNADNTSKLRVTLAANRKWGANALRKRGWWVLLNDVDPMKIRANDGASSATNTYDITVEDFEFAGGSPQNGTQDAGLTRFYSVEQRGSGQTNETAVRATIGRSGTLRNLEVTVGANTLDGPTTITIFRNGTASGLTVTLAAGARRGHDTSASHAIAVNNGDTISARVVTAGTTGRIKNLQVTVHHAAPSSGSLWVLEGFSTIVPDPWVGTQLVRSGSGRTLTWDQLLPVVDATRGARISPGIIQTLISTARGVIPWLNAIQPNIFTRLGIPAPPSTIGGFLNDWLLHAPHSILVGAAYIRQGYNRHASATAFDLPLVGSAYNHGFPKANPSNPWGLSYFHEYVENAGPHANAAATLFNTSPAPTPAPTVRFMR